jgi:aerobic-type carbon monoxide dehydrogenase small subunit (CoxS/CutS family)
MKLSINGQTVEVQASPKARLLWVLRDELGLTGTKYGCGKGLCGSCTVHLNGKTARSCLVPLERIAGRAITTIEGLAPAGGLHPVQRAWIEHEVIQCGYCQPGQIMTAAALLKEHPQPRDAEIDSAMAGVLCRCGTYERIRAAIKTAADLPTGAARKGAKP